jgi:exodeoxyribonuclease V alpha subunit
VLAPFVDAGVFGAFEVQLASTIARLQPGAGDDVILALTVAARAPGFGHVCVDLDSAVHQISLSDDADEPAVSLPWPSAEGWTRAVAASPLVMQPALGPTVPARPLVWDEGHLYLQRYWHYEVSVARALADRAEQSRISHGQADATGDIDRALAAVFGEARGDEDDLQREAARRSLAPGVSIIAGGPGTGKTHTIARLLAAAHLVRAEDGRDLRVALVAPTGKAAARMRQAVQQELSALQGAGGLAGQAVHALAQAEASTVHRLLGWGEGTHFRHNRSDPIRHDMVIVDETSMVSLPLMAKLLDAVRPQARLVLVGDPYQLASVEAGTVMGDVVGPAVENDPCPPGVLADRITVLRRMRRFSEDSAIAALAEAIRRGDADAAVALLDGTRRGVTWMRNDDVPGVAAVRALAIAAGIEVVRAALEGDTRGALDAAHRTKVLAATRRGPFGLYEWSDRIEHAVAEAVPGLNPSRRWYVGKPVIVTGNDPLNHVFNGDVGVVMDRAGSMTVDLAGGDEARSLPPARLDRAEAWWAMTIHKSQGSEFSHAIVSLPEVGSPILTRELLYTAVTRASERVTIVSSEDALRSAIGRPIARASGLRGRLWGVRDRDGPPSGALGLAATGF